MKLGLFRLQSVMVGASLLLGSAMSYAESTLLVGEHVVVTNIDGQKISSGLLSPTRKFVLPAGEHRISAKYKRLYELSSDEHDVLRSASITVTGAMKDGEVYQLDMVNQPEDYDTAIKYAEKPTLSLTHKGQTVAQKSAISGSGGGFLSGLAGIVSGKREVSVNTVANPQAAAPSVVHHANTTVLDKFMQLWLQASPSERQKIKSWVKDQ